ncbi:MAG: c-type cytochrome [Flavobacteriales bacterium]|nr:c-type cytochrome [Flavobacteriales bacterium]
MKNKLATTWKAFIAFSILPSALFAQDNNYVSGVSDIALLTIMLLVIVILLLVINAIARSIISINRKFNHNNNTNTIAKAIIGIVLIGSSINANAAPNSTEAVPFVMSQGLFITLTVVILFLAAIIMYLFNTLKIMIKLQSGESFEDEKDSVFDVINSSLTDNVPIEDESNVMLDHVYDGIRELDNNLPPWWKYMFYGTIIFSFVYMFRYHVTGDGQLQTEEYLTKMAEAAIEKETAMAEAGDQVTEDNVSLMISEADLEKGAAIYAGNCATCHRADGGGGAGPNLTDEYWIHGGSIGKVFATIKYGVPAKGMIAWQSQFNPTQIQQVSSYVLSLQGSNPAGGTAPQGEKWTE